MTKLRQIKKFLHSTEFDLWVKIGFAVLLLIVLFSFGVANYLNLEWALIALVDGIIIATVVFTRWPNAGLYLTAFLFPFWGWEFISGGINVPYVDVVALALFLAVLYRTLVVWIKKKQGNGEKNYQAYFKKFPGALFFGLFFVAAAAALINNEFLGEGIKYLLRPILYFYLLYVLVPVNLLAGKRLLKRVMGVMLTSGILTGLIGLGAVLSNSGSLFMRRATGIEIFGLNFLGGNHNAVAEVMIATIPIAFILYLITNKIKNRGWFVVGLLFLVAILMLTLSRTGWLALFVELLLLYFILYAKKLSKHRSIVLIIILLFFLLAVYFGAWGQMPEVQGSNSSRWLMTSIAWNHYLDHPLIGNGLNSFSRMIGNTFVYIVEFGDPLDSHGFVQKLLAETGALGLITFILFLTYLFGQLMVCYRDTKDEKARAVVLSFLVLFLGVVFFQLFSTSYFIVKMWLPIGVALAGARLYSSNHVTHNT